MTCFLLSKRDGHTQPRPWPCMWQQALGAWGQWHSPGDKEEHLSQAQKGTKEGVKPKGVGTGKVREDASEDNTSRSEAVIGPPGAHPSVWSVGPSLRELGHVQKGRLGHPVKGPQRLTHPCYHSHQPMRSCASGDPSLWTSSAGGPNTYLPSGTSGSAAVFQVPDLRYDLQARTT